MFLGKQMVSHIVETIFRRNLNFNLEGVTPNVFRLAEIDVWWYRIRRLREVKNFSSKSFSSDTLQGKSLERSRIETELSYTGESKVLIG